jgi:Ulp1 family protease
MVTVRSFHTLQHGRWMDDEAINGYLSLLTNREIIHHAAGIIPKPSMHLPTHFYTKLINPTESDPQKRGYRYDNVRGWGARLSPLSNLFHMESIFIPLHIGASHWAAVLVNNTHKTITYLDSLRWNGQQHLEHIFQYLQDEHMALFQAPLPVGPSGWHITPAPENLPRQTNTYDCGAYLCFFAYKSFPISDYHATPTDIHHFQEHIGVSIANNAATIV